VLTRRGWVELAGIGTDDLHEASRRKVERTPSL